MKNSKFQILTENFDIIFDHVTDIPGLADSVKHVEGFYNICETLKVMFRKEKVVNSRSQVAGGLNPAQITGLEELILAKSKNAESLLSGDSDISVFDLDFNKAVTGCQNAHTGSALIANKSYMENIDSLCRGIVEQIFECDIKSSIDNLKSKGVRTLHLRFSVSHVSVIARFIQDDLSSFADALSEITNRKYPIDEDENILRVVVHYRLADTKVFKLQDGRLVSAWGNWRRSELNGRIKPSDPEYLEKLTDAAYEQFDFADFVLFIKSISDICERLNKSVKLTFLSDGFSKGLERVSEFSQQLELADDDIEHLYSSYNEEEKNMKSTLDNLQLADQVSLEYSIGETRETFEKSIRALIQADILIAGVGGFSRTIFNKFGFKSRKAILERVVPENLPDLEEQFEKFITVKGL